MINFYIVSKSFFLKREELSDGRVASITNKEYDFTVYFLQIFINSLKSISDESGVEVLVYLEFSK